MNKIYLILSFCLISVIFSCKKGTPADEYYFKKIKVELLQLPLSPDLDIYFNNKKIATIDPSKGSFLSDPIVQIGLQARLSIYLKDTKTLVADSLITIDKNLTQQYNIWYSEELGLKGWMKLVHIPNELISWKLKFNLKDPDLTYPELDMHFFGVNGRTFIDLNKVIRIKTNQVFSMPDLNAFKDDGRPENYCFRISDPKTGDYLDEKPTSLLGGAYYGGHFTFSYLTFIKDANGILKIDNKGAQNTIIY